MVALWIVLGLLALLALLGLVRVGVEAEYAAALTVRARVGPVRIAVLPRPERPEKPKKEKKKKPPAEGEGQAAEKPKRPKPDLKTLTALARLGLQAANRFRRRLTVERLRLLFVAGAPDPSDTALQYARVLAALGSLQPLAERALRIRTQDIQVGADFTAEKPRIEAGLALTIRVGQLAAIGAAFGFGYLKWTLRQPRAAKKEHTKQAAPAAERMTGNGNG